MLLEKTIVQKVNTKIADTPIPTPDPNATIPEPELEQETFDFEDDDNFIFISATPSSTAKLTSISSNMVDFDDTSVEKLKQAKKKG